MKDSTSICMSCVAIELFSAFITAGRGGKFPNFFGCSGLEFTFVSSCLTGTGFANGFC